MATTKKKRSAKKAVRKNATKSKPTRKNPAKKKVVLAWGKAVKAHPVSGKPCAGRPMSQRDQKLFTKMGKRRAGVTPSMVKEAYGLKKNPVAKKKAPAKKTTAKKTTAKKKTAKRNPAAKKKTKVSRHKGKMVTVSGLPARPQQYIIVDGRMRYQSSSRLLTTARKKQAALEVQNQRKKFRIVKLEKV